MKKYDVIIIGAGPSGIFCAYELIQKNKAQNVLLIEQGRNIKSRVCPISKTKKCLHCKPYCNITSGFAGAGAFSDGKLLSYHLSMFNENGDFYLGGNGGSFIKDYYSSDEIKELLTYTDNIYLKFGAEPHLEGVENKDEILKLQKKAFKEKLNLVDIPLRHLGTEKSQELYAKLQDYILDNGVEIKFDTTVSDLIVENCEVKGVMVYSAFDDNKENKTIEKIYSDKVI